MAVVKRKLPTKSNKKKAEEKLKVRVSLPTAPSEPSNRLQDYSILIYGEKKIGKTTMSSHFKRTFFLMFETGAKALAIHKRLVKDWDEFRAYTRLIERDKSFDTIVLDPIDIAYKYCTSYICKKMIISHPSDEEWGKGWSAIRDEFMTEMSRLLASGKGIIFISHATEKEIKTRTGDKYHKILPTMSNQARETLEGVVDIWVYYSYEGKQRYLVIGGDDHIGAGHRLETRFKYPDGTPIQKIDMGRTSREAYDNFMLAFNNLYERKGGPIIKKKVSLKVRKR